MEKVNRDLETIKDSNRTKLECKSGQGCGRCKEAGNSNRTKLECK